MADADSLHGAEHPIYAPFPSLADFVGAAGEFDFASFDLFTALMAEAKASAPPEVLSAAVDRVTRSAAVDTGAIEGLYPVTRGFTRTIAEYAANWESVLADRGEPVRRAVEDALNAYEYVLDAVTGQHGPITELWIKELHAIVCASQETYEVFTQHGPEYRPLPKGQYKTGENQPTNIETGVVHAYAPVLDTPAEMARLVREIATPQFSAAHPLIQAAYAHYAFVCVHPFADGNGRVARAFASVFLYRQPGVPLLIFADERTAYLDALESADAARTWPFIDFVRERTAHAVELVQMHAAQLTARSVRQVTLQRFLAALEAHDGMTHLEIDALAMRLLDEVWARMREGTEEIDLPAGLSFGVSKMGGDNGVDPPAGYRKVLNGPWAIYIAAQSQPPAQTSAAEYVNVFVAIAGSDNPLFRISTTHGQSVDLAAIDVRPATTMHAQVKVEAFVDVVITDLLQTLYSSVDSILRQAGYR
ncbi:MAG TPA: Fic family protein [Jatrophihabitans sp.]|nr:Fic family protein [Jatrophihabitans sp.]